MLTSVEILGGYPGIALALTLALALLLLLWRRAWDAEARGPSSISEPETAEPALGQLINSLPGVAYRRRVEPPSVIELASGACEEVLGYQVHQLLGREGLSFTDLIHPADRDRVTHEVRQAVQEEAPYTLTYRVLRRGGAICWLRDRGKVVPAADGDGLRLEGFLADVTSEKEAEERLRHEATHDRLTGLGNRALLLEHLERSIRRTRRRGQPFALFFLDLDRFTVINEKLGHELGDRVLVAMGRRLQACLRDDDTIARLGADQFGLLVEDLQDAGDALRVAERIGQVIELPLYLRRQEVQVTASIGIALSLSAVGHAEDLLGVARNAMQRAKEDGGGRHALFDRQTYGQAVARLELETELRQAVQRQEFRFLYQPIVSLEDRRILGFEALLRWDHPERGLVPPREFLGTALESGLIVPISWWALKQACGQMRAWQDQLHVDSSLYVSVNLTSKQFACADLVERIQASLFESGLRPRNLRIEITESLVMDQGREVQATLDRIRRLGVHLSLDDFGTGYSSLSSLSEMPIRSIKMDRAFIEGIEERLENLQIARTIVELAHNLDMEVIAEGIEKLGQLEVLQEIGCDHGQGFFFARPLEPEAIGPLLLTQSTRAEGQSDFA